MIESQGLVKRYGPATVLQNISFKAEQGEILGFLGPNGAGKTTTMRILTGYLPPSAGQASIAGHDVVQDSRAARQNLGYLPENVPLYPEMSVADYLLYMARLRRVPRRREALARAMEMVSITDRAGDRIGKLSKGYRQRVGLAQALLHDPPVLILDEPTVGLDPRQIIEVRELIRSLGGERTIILSTHILPEVSMLCDRIIIINQGRIAAIDTPERLTNRLQGRDHVHLQIGRSTPETATELSHVEGVQAVQDRGNGVFDVECDQGRDLRATLAAFVVERGWGLLELRATNMSLEEVFLQLTMREEHTKAETSSNRATTATEPADAAAASPDVAPEAQPETPSTDKT